MGFWKVKGHTVHCIGYLLVKGELFLAIRVTESTYADGIVRSNSIIPSLTKAAVFF